MSKAAELLRDGALPVNQVAELGGLPPAGSVRQGLPAPPRRPAVQLPGGQRSPAPPRPHARQLPSRTGLDARPRNKMPRVKGHPLARMIIYSVIAAVIGTVAVLLLDWFPTRASTAAEPIDVLYDVLLIASVPIFVLVMAVAIYCVVKFRAKPGRPGRRRADPRQHPPRDRVGDRPLHHGHRARGLRLDRPRRHRGQGAEHAGGRGPRPAVRLALHLPRRGRA